MLFYFTFGITDKYLCRCTEQFCVFRSILYHGEGYSPGFAALKVPAAEPGGGA